MDYYDFLKDRDKYTSTGGFKPNWMPDFLFDFQKYLTDWSITHGRSAILADCGLGKTPMSLVWAENVVRETNKPVLFITPLAVGQQAMREAEKFGVDAKRSRDGKVDGSLVWITNYEQLHKFEPNQFGGVVCDESSAIKNFKSARRDIVTEFLRGMKYRLLCTATAAPNDFHEVGTSSEALGHLGYRDMITEFFKQETSKDHRGWGRSKYRFKGHAETPFWKWVSSWARALRSPSDLGFDASRFVLPELVETETVVQTKKARDGYLFALAARDLREQREERRNSIEERCEAARVNVVSHDGPSVLWCELNAEGNRLRDVIPGAKQVTGSMPDERKEELLEAFTKGEINTLITKPKIGCWGLNWQHCNNVVIFPSHSFEQYYQAVRRCWRFGQTEEVKVNVIVNEGEVGVMKNIRRKSMQADKMFSSLCRHMNDSITISTIENFKDEESVPSWL